MEATQRKAARFVTNTAGIVCQPRASHVTADLNRFPFEFPHRQIRRFTSPTSSPQAAGPDPALAAPDNPRAAGTGCARQRRRAGGRAGGCWRRVVPAAPRMAPISWIRMSPSSSRVTASSSCPHGAILAGTCQLLGQRRHRGSESRGRFRVSGDSFWAPPKISLFLLGFFAFHMLDYNHCFSREILM